MFYTCYHYVYGGLLFPCKIVSDVITFMVGGFHTSGYMTTWLLWYLSTNPASQDRLYEELKREVGGDYGEKLKVYSLRSDTYVSH